MIAYKPVGLRPAYYSDEGALKLGRIIPSSSQLGQYNISPGMVKGVGGTALIVALALSAGATWVGIRTGLKERGFLSITGWVVGVAGALTGLAELTGLVALAAVPVTGITIPAPPAPVIAPAPGGATVTAR